MVEEFEESACCTDVWRVGTCDVVRGMRDEKNGELETDELFPASAAFDAAVEAASASEWTDAPNFETSEITSEDAKHAEDITAETVEESTKHISSGVGRLDGIGETSLRQLEVRSFILSSWGVTSVDWNVLYKLAILGLMCVFTYV